MNLQIPSKQFYLLVIGKSTCLEWVVSNQIMGFRDHCNTKNIRAGDAFALYRTRGAFGRPARDSSVIVGVGVFASPVQSEQVIIEEEVFPKSAKLAISEVTLLDHAHGMNFKMLVPRLTFITKKSGWAAYLRQSVVRICNQDYDCILREFRQYNKNLASSQLKS